ncbi:MAG: COX15/CtaA family protein, partial [Burkholderiales bacterium]|nr:COX15/CtaA family protein [Burkholderiales bacterium]
DPSGLRPWAWLALALVALQVGAGGMISAHHAAFACETFPLCDGRGWPSGVGLEAFNPWRELAPPVDAAARSDPARQAVLAAHRLLGVPTLLLLAWLGGRTLRSGLRGPGRALLILAIAQAGLGVGQAALGQPLVLAVAHNVAAAGVVIALASLLARLRAA